MKLEKLTQQQENRVPEICAEWLDIGLSCEPVRMETLRPAVDLAYQCAGLELPQYIFIADSPVSGAVMSAMMQDGQVMDQVWAQVRAQVWDQVGAQVSAQVRAQVWDQVWAQVSAHVGAQVSAQVRAQVWDQVWDQIYGAHDSNWLAFYAAMSEFGVDCQGVEGLICVAKNCGWWAPYKNVAICQHRQVECHMQDGRLHNEDGPAVLYRDGFSVWSINGVRVTQQIVESPETLSVDAINAIENEEVKRISIERFGWQRYLTDSNAIVVEERDNDIECTHEALMSCQDIRVLVCACPSTARVYAMEVPHEVDTCEAAQSWLRGDDVFYASRVIGAT